MHYWIAIHHPHDFDPPVADDATMRDIDQLNDEMIAASVRVFAGGLQPPAAARAIRTQADGGTVVTDGPYLQTREYVGGFWILDVADLDAALAWGRKAAMACRTPVEVRPFF